jgi:hypothetical protein
MLKLRRGIVVDEDPLVLEVDGERRRAWADTGLVGEVRRGDEVVVNVEAQDLGLGSGGFDVVHVNLTRGLAGEGPTDDRHVMKLNYTSLQHAVEHVEGPDETGANAARPPVLVIPLNGHLAPQGPRTVESTTRSASPAGSTPRARRSGGTRSSPAPARASSDRRPDSAMAGWRRSTPHTLRSRSAARRSSRHGCRAATRVSGTSA